MSGREAEQIPFEQRRGVPDEDAFYETWQVCLIREAAGEGNPDPDSVIDRLMARGVVVEAQRNVQEQVLEGSFPAPADDCVLLVQLRGQSWLYLCLEWQNYDLPKQLAEKAGVAIVMAGHQDTAGATYVAGYEGDSTFLYFESVGYEDAGDPGSKSDARFESGRHQRKWLNQFEDEFQAQSALLRELDAYGLILMGGATDGRVSLAGFDGDDIDREVVTRVDVLVLGNAGDRDQPGGRGKSR